MMICQEGLLAVEEQSQQRHSPDEEFMHRQREQSGEEDHNGELQED